MATLELGPRERAKLQGVEQLGDDDLVAILLGTGGRGRPVSVVASQLLAAAGGLLPLARGGVREELPAMVGVGEAKRTRLEAAFELGRRVAVRGSLRPKTLMAPPDVAAWGRAQLGGLGHEEIWVLALDSGHGLLAARRVAQGAIDRCATTSRDILRIVLRAGASGFVLVHNHPGGDPTPSPEDEAVTRTVARVAELAGVTLVDHVIVAADRHTSLYELGVLG